MFMIDQTYQEWQTNSLPDTGKQGIGVQQAVRRILENLKDQNIESI